MSSFFKSFKVYERGVGASGITWLGEEYLGGPATETGARPPRAMSIDTLTKVDRDQSRHSRGWDLDSHSFSFSIVFSILSDDFPMMSSFIYIAL